MSSSNDNGFNYELFKKTFDEFPLKGTDRARLPSKFPKNIQSFRLQANESYYFYRFFLFITKDIIGHSEIRDIIKDFIEIVNIIECFLIPESILIILEKRIESFLIRCTETFPSMSITVKFHHMVHYPRLIAEFGLLRLCSTINLKATTLF